MGLKQSLYLDKKYTLSKSLSETIHKCFFVKNRPDIGFYYSLRLCTKLAILIEDQLETISMLQELKLNLTVNHNELQQEIEEILNTKRHSEKHIFLLKTIYDVLIVHTDSGYEKDNKKHIMSWLQSLQTQKL